MPSMPRILLLCTLLVVKELQPEPILILTSCLFQMPTEEWFSPTFRPLVGLVFQAQPIPIPSGLTGDGNYPDTITRFTTES